MKVKHILKRKYAFWRTFVIGLADLYQNVRDEQGRLEATATVVLGAFVLYCLLVTVNMSDSASVSWEVND